jgi:hypothetical protein
MAVDYKELDEVLDMMGAKKDTRPLPKSKSKPPVKPKKIKTSFLPHKIVNSNRKNVT